MHDETEFRELLQGSYHCLPHPVSCALIDCSSLYGSQHDQIFSLLDIFRASLTHWWALDHVFEQFTHSNQAPICERRANADLVLIWGLLSASSKNCRRVENQGMYRVVCTRHKALLQRPVQKCEPPLQIIQTNLFHSLSELCLCLVNVSLNWYFLSLYH